MPPIFPPQTGGSKPQQYLRRAMQFRDAATPLADYVSVEPNWPKYALLTHAMELTLKAFVFHAVEVEGAILKKEPGQHDLQGWYISAVGCGLAGDEALAGSVGALNALHITHFTRYPQSAKSPLPDASLIADDAIERLIFASMQKVFPR